MTSESCSQLWWKRTASNEVEGVEALRAKIQFLAQHTYQADDYLPQKMADRPSAVVVGAGVSMSPLYRLIDSV